MIGTSVMKELSVEEKNTRKNPEHVHSRFPGSINNGSTNTELGKNKRARLKITGRKIFES